MDAAEKFVDRLARNRAGEPVGVTSVCSAHPLVLEAAMRVAVTRKSLLLVEATCNQVNQDGGYTGLTPTMFRERLFAQADTLGLPRDSLLLGGDHLGPNPWRKRPATEAMQRAGILVAAFAAAGYRKLHLDASMSCADDPESLPPSTIAARAAELGAAAEAAAVAAGLPPPVYVVGTEVPTPGGAREALDHLAPTRPEDVGQTLALHRAAFAARGLEAALARAVAVVVQPGVEFGQEEVHDYRPEASTALVAALAAHPGVVFEAHSTDYQREPALRALVAGHFAILKVGPELTFAMREAVFALDAIAGELVSGHSGARAALAAAMARDPSWWRGYYAEDDHIAREFSLSDRLRYYWPVTEVAVALDKLLGTFATKPIPPTLVSQYLPGRYAAWRDGRAGIDAPALVLGHVSEVLRRYGRAAGE
jgi:D-tagatose-1,6-bisphosphate aldolase subunit GatZ/KbaZ